MTTPVVAFLTMKGGVGKTTLAANLTRALADRKKRKILLIDADSQCNLSQVFFDSEVIESLDSRSIFHAFDTQGRPLYAGDIKKTIYPTEKTKASPLGSTIDFVLGSFATFELSATASAARRDAADQRFKSFIDQAKNEYDLIVIDTNPSATFVTMQALKNSNFLVAPTTLDVFSMQGIHLVVSELKKTIQWLGDPERICIIPNKAERENESTSSDGTSRQKREEDRIAEKYPNLKRSIKIERIHKSALISNRDVAKGFFADHSGQANGYFDNIVYDFNEAAKALDVDIANAFPAQRQPPSEAPRWYHRLGFGGSSPRA